MTKSNTEVINTNKENSEEKINYTINEKIDSISISLNITKSVSNYFNIIKEHLKSSNHYTKINGRLDYVLSKRFLKTTYNNLIEIDLDITTKKIQTLNHDLKDMDAIYSDFNHKTEYPHHAYTDVFLSHQIEYISTKKDLDYIVDKLYRLRSSEKTMSSLIKNKKLKAGCLTDEIKRLNGTYADTVHMMAELDNRRKHNLNIVYTFEEKHKIQFKEIFQKQAIIHKKSILDILAAQAFAFDDELWIEAKKSTAIKKYFKNSSVNSDLNTETYLKYYLDSLDMDKMKEESKKLLELYDYLKSIHKEYILIIMSSSEDVIEHDMTLKRLQKNLNIKAFIDEKSAIVWAKKNTVKILIMEERLRSMSAKRFLDLYQKNVFVQPEIIFLGNKPQSITHKINIELSNNVSSKIISDKVKIILDNAQFK